MKIRLGKDERYPEYVLCENGFWEVDIDTEKAARWKHIAEQFEATQKEMVAEIIKAGGKF